jgi:hypothetical protein
VAGEACGPVVATGHLGRRADSVAARGSGACPSSGGPRAASAQLDLGPRPAAHRGAGARSGAARGRGQAHVDFDSDAIVDPDRGRSLVPGVRARAGAGDPRLRGARAVHLHERARTVSHP